MIKRFSKGIGTIVIAVIMLSLCCMPGYGLEKWNSPLPSTDYAKTFIEKCEGQEWFIQEVERLLNLEQKTLDTIEGPEAFQNIKALGFKDEEVEGKIPAAIGELTELRYLFLSGNHLSGEIPAELFTLSKLENIDLTENDYAGSIPEGFGTMASLAHLSLRGNAFTGTIPSDLFSDTRITFLDVSDNHLSGAIPAALNQMTSLEYLNLSEND